MNQTGPNLDHGELAKFAARAGDWWNPHGSLRTLHHINPVRLQYIAARGGLDGRRVLDLGCGGGLLTEAMAARGARVTGLDADPAVLEVATGHARESGLDIDYVAATAEEYAGTNPRAFDIITCMELLEHVPDPPALIAACAQLIRPGGHLFMATINRNLKSYAAAVLGAEYLLGLLPRGTHDYTRFIRPAELCDWLRAQGFSISDIAGMAYVPGLHYCCLTTDPSVNYLLHAQYTGG